MFKIQLAHNFLDQKKKQLAIATLALVKIYKTGLETATNIIFTSKVYDLIPKMSLQLVADADIQTIYINRIRMGTELT